MTVKDVQDAGVAQDAELAAEPEQVAQLVAQEQEERLVAEQ